MHSLIATSFIFTMNKSLPIFLCLLTLSGCQMLPANTEAETPAVETTTTSQPEQPSRNFSGDTLYDLLLAELAGQRQQPQLALERYQRQLQTAQSPLVAERTFLIAEYMDERETALQSALLWADLAPDNANAHRAAALELAKNGQFEQALEHTSQAITLDPNVENHFDFIAFTATHADPTIRPALLNKFEQLLQQHPQLNELRLGQAILLQEENPEQALRILQSIPGDSSTPALALQARLYQQMEQPEKSLQIQLQLIERQPENTAARLNYARHLINSSRYEESPRSVFAPTASRTGKRWTSA